MLVNEYLRSLRIRKAPDTTYRTATSILLGVERITGKELENCTHADLVHWQEARSSELSPRSLRSQIGTVRGCFRWALDTGFLKADPSVGLRAPRVGQTLPRPISERKLALAYVEATPRVRAILCLGAFAGLRCSEIAQLAWADVMLDNSTPHLYVHGKGRRERVVDISPDLQAVLEALPDRRGPVIRRGDGKPGHNTPNNISKVMSRFFHELGIPDTMHATRHRMLTEVCRIGGARQAQEVAGHASLATTSIYTKVLRTDLRPTVVEAGRLNLRPPA